MSRSNKKKPSAPRSAPNAVQSARAVASARLRAQTRKVLGKHYRAKYGVR